MSKAQKTANSFEEQDALGRTYATANDPHTDADKKRIGDTWILEETKAAKVSKLTEQPTAEFKNLSGVAEVKSSRLQPKKKRSLNKYTRYHHKKEY